MHRLLKRQLKSILGKFVDIDQLTDREKQLVEQVSLTYEDNDKEIKHYEHILEVNSRELNEKNRVMTKVLSSLSEAQRLSQTGSWALEINSKVLEWSDELYRVFGLEPKAIQPSSDYIYQLVHSDDRELADSGFELTYQNSVFDSIYRLCFESGEIKFVHEYREVVYDHKNEAVAIHGTIQDVTAQKIAEEKLHLYANVFRNSGESILITDKNVNIIAVNDAFTEATGFSLDELKGKNPRVLSDGNTPHRVYEKMWSELKSKGYWQGELSDRRKNGETYPKWMSISVSYSNSGEVSHYIASFSDISERIATQERIHYLAHHDALTGLVNRFSLEERLSQALHGARRSQTKVALMFIDMDRFKSINDTMGHPVGDAVLIEVASRLTNSVRECDIVSRIGGDEFVIVFTDIKDELSVAPLARFIVHSLGQPYMIESQKAYSSPSIGISFFPSNGKDGESLMKSADSAMYHAKEMGRNNYQFFSESLNANANERLKMENDLRKAIEEGQFELYYQPQICTSKNEACGVEALLRWHHPERGNVSPDDFIPVAEETNLIVPLGLWVLAEACRQQSEWKKKYNKSIRMAVNLSAQQLQSTELVREIKLNLGKYGISDGELELEITESTAMQNPDEAIKRLHEIRALGVELAIDDFGTGYSSLAYLKLLPIQTLKLDRGFVKDLENDNNNAEISAAALALAHNIGLQVVAEGVETKAQQDFLIERDCEILQGFYFSKALPAEEAAEFLFGK